MNIKDELEKWSARIDALEKAILAEIDNRSGMALLGEWLQMMNTDASTAHIDAQQRKLQKIITLERVRELRISIGSRLTEKALELGGLKIEQPGKPGRPGH